MSLFASPEFKVGLLVVAVSGLIGYMSLKVAQGPGLWGNTRPYYFVVDDAGGLVKDSAVKMAGIKVGSIDEIQLKDGKAHVKLQIESDVPIRTSSRVEIQPDGILGDKHVELTPGRLSDPRLESGEKIREVFDKGSIDKLLNEVGRATESLSSLAKTLNNAAKGQQDQKTSLGRIIYNIESVTKDLKGLTSESKGQIANVIDRVDRITATLDRFVNDESAEGFQAGWKRATDSLSRIDSSLRNIEEITGKVNSGEGTLGRLVNDEKTVEELNVAIENVNSFLGAAQKLETSIDFHSEFMSDAAMTKSYLGVKIQPGLDRYYEVQVIDDPRGVEESVRTETVQNGRSLNVVERERTFRNRIKISALFAKNFYDFTVKGGLMQNAGGVGFDYYFFNRDLRFSLEAFDFNEPHVRAFARYDFYKGIYLIGGGDDFFAESDDRAFSSFFGAGIFLTNEDLKTFASQVSF